ncbi:hypothetical protein SLS62_006667 [Diatrype stigma]|uniref:Uncharacterized protein n=1 Tax=Diatrype stigma TaxID=117547 RepID=A0AAN9UQM0_9PEZI
MCGDFIGHCACSCGCKAELEKTTVPCSDDTCGGVTIPVHYEVFDYRCSECWPWTPEATPQWSQARRGECWWYVPSWKRRSLLSGPVPGPCVNGKDIADLPSPLIRSQDFVSQIYRHLDFLYGDAMELGLTIDDLESRTGIPRNRKTIVSQYPALSLTGLEWLSY